MSKTIKIIDLFLKIANNEELPRRIKFEGCIYKLIPTINYYCEETKIFWLDILYGASLNNSLNYEVEIIEEQEEIDIQELEEIKEMEVLVSVDTRQTLEENFKKIDKHEVNFFFKINEIIRKQNKIVQYLEQLDKNIKELGWNE